MTATLVALVALAAAHSVSGRVVDGSTGKPMSGAVVVLWERSGVRSEGTRSTVGPDGAFEFANVAPGSYLVAPTMPGMTVPYRTETIDVEIRNESVTGLGLVITPLGPRPVSVTGRVVMEGGGALPASVVRVQAARESSAVQRDGSFQLPFRAQERYALRFEKLPEGTYVKNVSAGTWDPVSETLVFSATPSSTLQITLEVGTRTIRGRVLDPSGAAAGPQTSLTLSRRSGEVLLGDLALNRDGTFEIARLRSGGYELKARLGSGTATQFARLAVVIGDRDLSGLEVVPLTRQAGRVVIEGVGRLEDLERFQPVMEITDVLGVHRIPIAADGTFEFQSFPGEYSAEIRNLPVSYSRSISITRNGSAPSFVLVTLRVIQGDGFFIVPRPR
jgi:Carboxypeptidase regulatory-like domain